MLTLREHWRTGQVTRYHANPPLNRLLQTTADHSCGMLILLFALNCRPSMGLVQAIINHDRGEFWVGDTPGPAKRRFPHLRRELHDAEDQALREAGIPTIALTEEELLWLNVLDQMESAIFMAEHGKPWNGNQVLTRIVWPLESLGIHRRPEEFQ